MSAANTGRAHATPEADHVQPELTVVAIDPRSAQDRSPAARWMLAALVVLSCLFAAGLVRYVLFPAAATVSGTSTSTPVAEGP